MWHGQADPLVLPNQSIDYYNDVVKKFGKQSTENFFRLFLVPSMGHCWELPAALPDRMNMLQVMEDWVENGIAPTKIAVHSSVDEDDNSLNAKVGQLHPYPSLATYSP